MNWKALFPRVDPLFAVKSNYDVNVLKLLAYLGTGFDCSSQAEIELVLSLNNVHPDRIIFANPCKITSQIIYARDNDVKDLVFDNDCELLKIKQFHPKAECFLRIKANSLPKKFGSDMNSSRKLIKQAIELNIKLKGICFYVGFRQQTADNIIESIKNARCLFDYAREEFNYEISCLDIGGGFPGSSQSSNLMTEMATKINATLERYFPRELFSPNKFKIIAELGTYYTCSAYTLCVNVIGRKETEFECTNEKNSFQFLDGTMSSFANSAEESVKPRKVDDSKSFIYYVNNSTHASFKWYNVKDSPPLILSAWNDSSKEKEEKTYYRSSLAGCTCDSCDFVLENFYMPELNVNEFLIFKNMGSYTKTCAVGFNGIPLPKTFFVSTKLWHKMKDAFK